VRTPFLDDLRRADRYCPVLGRFTTLDRFLNQTEMPGRMESFKSGSYFSPFLVQSVAREQADPISRYVREWSLRHRVEAVTWCADMAALLTKGLPDASNAPELREALELAEPDIAAGVHEELASRLADVEEAGLGQLRDVIAPGGAGDAGWLVVNPWSFARKAVISVPSHEGYLTAGDAVSTVHVSDGASSAIVELPPCGFTWIPRSPHAPAAGERPKFPSADGLVLRNEFFEVMLSDVTGGIAQIRTFKRSPNRLSQQLALRYPRERTITTGEGEQAESYKSYYTEMQLKESRVIESSPTVGAIETVGSLIDQLTGDAVADFQQVTRVRRGRPVVEVEIELTPHRAPEGDPWSNYLGVRWAWKWESVAVSRSLFQTAHSLGDEQRFESPHFIEIADDNDRTTIVTHGLTFHRKIGPRMVDTLLMTAGETRRSFRFDIAIDERYPMQTALDAMSPPLVLRCAKKPAIPEAWLMHVSARNVIVLGLRPLDADEQGRRPQGCIVRLLETEGRHRSFALKTFRSPTAARQRDFIGQTVQQCRVSGDETTVEIAPYEICDIELTF
jgi:alpha-mannosidase